jgi:hypothetical protein
MAPAILPRSHAALGAADGFEACCRGGIPLTLVTLLIGWLVLALAPF